MRSIAMIPARMGSKRLTRKNLRLLGGLSLVAHAVRKCKEANVFDEIWVNSESPLLADIADEEGVRFHRRPDELANDTATSEQYVYEFLKAHPCDYLFQVHSIAPLATSDELRRFVRETLKSGCDVMLSAVPEQIECAIGGQPINFTFDTKTNSQELEPIQRIAWTFTAWRSATYIDAFEAGRCATYAGRVEVFHLGRLAGHIIKTEDDLRIAEALVVVAHSTD